MHCSCSCLVVKEIVEFLGSHVVKAFCSGGAFRGPAQLRGVEVAPLPGQGRSLLAKRDLPRGSVCLQEQPLASVATVAGGKPELHAETRLALQLLAASRAGLADLAMDLLDHGGRDPLALKSRAVVAVCAALCSFAALSNDWTSEASSLGRDCELCYGTF